MKLNYGVVNEGYKYSWGGASQDEDMFSQKSIKLNCGLNDWASFQVLLESDCEAILSLDETTAFSKIGAVPCYRINVDAPEGIKTNICAIGLMEDDDGIYKADILLEGTSYVDMKPRQAQSVWVEFSIPVDFKPGNYTGSVDVFVHTVFQDEQKICSMPFLIEVINTKIPQTNEWSFHLDLWQHCSNIARKHEVKIWSDSHFDILEGYVKSLADLGQKAISVIASEIPWSGQHAYTILNYPSDMYEYSMVNIARNIDGKFEYDFSAMERYILLCFKYGIESEIEVFGLANIWQNEKMGFGAPCKEYTDGIRLRYKDFDGIYKYVTDVENIRDYIKAVESWFVEKGWINKVLVVADEPHDVDKFRIHLNELKDTAPKFKYKTAINHTEFVTEFKSELTDFVPSLHCVCDNSDFINEFIPNHNGRMLWYVCCGPDYPNTFLRSKSAESRLIGPLTWFMGLDGFLRWNYTVWPEKPREKISYRGPIWKAGDTNFVYPSYGGKPLLTLRWKWLRRGIEDYELIRRVSLIEEGEKIIKKFFEKILVSCKIIDFIDGKPEELYNTDYTAYDEARFLLIKALENNKEPTQQLKKSK